MNGLTAAAIVVAAGVLVEIALPGRAVYHAGWYNVLLVALVCVAAIAGRREYRRHTARRARLGTLAITFGAAILGFAGAASGLLAPDDRTVIGAPGQRIALPDLGATLVFPLARAANESTVSLEGSGGSLATIGATRHYTGSFALRTFPRDVVAVEARDRRGGNLTITQPTGTVFLSPVLLMQQRQQIAGMDLPYDSFAVPAAHRIVKAVLFSPQEAAMMRSSIPVGSQAVLFAVDDDEDRPLPHAIALAASGQSVRAGGLWLRASALRYPAIEIDAIPSLGAAGAGTLVLLAGLFTPLRQRRERSGA